MAALPLLLLYASAILLAPSRAWQLPADMPDGVYEVNFEIQGLRHQNTIANYDMDEYANVSVTSKRPDHPVAGLALSHYSCLVDKKYLGLGNLMTDRAAAAAARAMLGTWCELHSPRKCGLVVAVVANTTSYLCNWDCAPLEPSHQQRCSRREVLLADREMDRFCGLQETGLVHMRPWKKDYGRGLKPGEICPRMERYPRPRGEKKGSNRRKELKPVGEIRPLSIATEPDLCAVECLTDKQCFKECKKQEEKVRKAEEERVKKGERA